MLFNLLRGCSPLRQPLLRAYSTLFAFTWVGATSLMGQGPAPGSPPVMQFPRSLTGGGLQHADIDQDRQGRVAVANNQGVLLFDGAMWQLLPLPNRTVVRSVEWMGEGLVVGGQGELGRFIPQPKTGSSPGAPLVYEDWSQKAREMFGEFEDVWRCTAEENGTVLVATDRFIARARPDGQLEAVYRGAVTNLFPAAGGWAFQVGDSLVSAGGGGLGMPRLGAGWRAEGAAKDADGAWVLLTHEHGVWTADGSGWKAREGEVDAFLRTHRTNCMLTREEGFCIGTSHGGLIATRDFRQIDIRVNESEGLSRPTVLALENATGGDVWVGLEGGLNRLLHSAPERIPQGTAQMRDAGSTSLHLGDRTYWGTSQGLWVQEGAGPLVEVPGTAGPNWSLQEVDGTVWLGHHRGGFTVESEGAVERISGTGVWGLWQVPGRDVWFAGTYRGLVQVRRDSTGAWVASGPLAGFEESARFLAFESENVLWVSHPYKGAWRIRLDPTGTRITGIQHFGKKQGFPSDIGIQVHQLDGQVLFTADRGFWEWNRASDQMVALKEIWNGLEEDARYDRLTNGPDGALWFFRNGHLGRIAPQRGGLNPTLEIRLAPMELRPPVSGFERLEFLPDGTVCVPTEQGFVSIDPQRMYTPQDAPGVQIRSITHLNSEGGESLLPTEPDIYLPPGTHALRFLLQGTDVRWLHMQTFEWRIPAISTEWSAPVGNPSLLLPALTTGDHALEFRARVGSVLVGPVLQITVHIPPPWYMTPWARMIFALLLLSAVGWLLHLRKRRWERKRKADLARQHEEMLQVSRQFQQSLQASEEALARERLARSEAELTGKNQELASTTMHLVQKSEVLQTIRQRLSALKPQLPRQVAKDIQGILDLTQQDERLDANWEQFSQHFDQVHVDFQNRLRERYPHLTKNDLKLCAYIRLNLSSKEIASLMFVTVRAVEISRFRLRKRLDLDKGINLNEFIQRI